MTELSSASHATPLDNIKYGSVGILLPNLECKVKRCDKKVVIMIVMPMTIMIMMIMTMMLVMVVVMVVMAILMMMMTDVGIDLDRR